MEMFSNHDLAAFLAVADMGSVRGAADALRRTQPAITQAIRRLEEAAGLVLLDRTSYRARLTDHGERFVERARVIVSETRALHDLASLLSSGVEPRIRLALDCAIPQEIWLELLGTIARTFPQTEIEVEAGEGAMLRPRLIAGDMDFAILFDQSINRQAVELESIRLGEAEFSTIIRADKIAGLEPDKALLPQILVVDFADPLQMHGLIEGQHYWRVSNHQMQVAIIRDGLGWGTVPRPLVEDDLCDGTLRAVAYRGLRERSLHHFSLCRRPHSVAGPTAEAFWQAALAQVEQGGATMADPGPKAAHARD